MDRAKSGKGQKVETALLRTAINITNSHLIEQAALQLNRIATLNRGSPLVPRTASSARTAGSTP
jgi:crotonobetainyl-CoA:carnitine CoA-transferase CaiB-like acyl-CoA transferase